MNPVNQAELEWIIRVETFTDECLKGCKGIKYEP